MASNLQSIHVYRQLLRSVNQAFKGDVQLISGAYHEIRSKFEEARKVQDLEQLKDLQGQGQEAAQFIRTSIVQAPTNEEGNIEMQVQPEHTGKYAEPIVEGMDLPKDRKKK